MLDGSRGIPNQENLYDVHAGQVQYVATITTQPFCFKSPNEYISDEACSDTPVVRMEVTPSGEFMAFVTASQVTQYDPHGHLEMYRYNAVTQNLVCVSCIPSGEPPTSDVEGSQNGLFITEDGRTVFTTDDALVHGDTNRGQDVYEYVDGRPQLITPGTGETRNPGGIFSGIQNAPGLQGISADGTDLYFSTLATLVPEDHNGLFLKFYDARSAGGFSNTGPPPACEAADKCHGAGAAPEAPIKEGTGVAVAGGNEAASGHMKKAKHGAITRGTSRTRPPRPRVEVRDEAFADQGRRPLGFGFGVGCRSGRSRFRELCVGGSAASEHLLDARLLHADSLLFGRAVQCSGWRASGHRDPLPAREPAASA